MLKFKNKKKSFFPKFSILIWLFTLLALLISIFYKDNFDINHLFAIVPSDIPRQIATSQWQVLRLIAALFLHGSWQHWAGNMILFLIIALPLEKKVGGFWFVLIYFISGFAANVSSIYQLSDSSHYLLGASAAVSGLLGAWLLLFPKQKISVIIPIGLYFQKAKLPVLLLALIWLSIQLILQITSQDGFPIVWGAHIVGFIIGFLVALLYRVTA
ncbi:MAG TPA: rhomboid family intramembrane serine protease [Oceanospirillales bacterium]|nr:rhomboid family intramembrane serine protease [Oceanospirillales bacterium]